MKIVTGKSMIMRLAPVLILTVILISGFGQASVFIQCPPDVDGIDTDGDGIVDNDNVCRSLAAGDGFSDMADGKTLYTFGFSDVTGYDGDTVLMMGMGAAEWPAPEISLRQGQRFYLTLTNVGMVDRPDLFDPHTVHFHGFPNAAPVFDGVPDASISVNMGSSFTYYYELVHPGTYMYHCHVEAPEHMEMGMLGSLWVEPIQNMLAEGTTLGTYIHHAGNKYAYNDGDGSTYYDVEKALQLGSMDPFFHDSEILVQPVPLMLMDDKYAMINGRGYPDTINPAPLANSQNGHYSQLYDSRIIATQGDQVLLRLSSLSVTKYFTVTALGIPMKVVGQGSRLLRGPDGKDLSYHTSSVTLGGGEAMDVILDTTDVPPGTYFLYTTNLNFLSNDHEDFGGMMTEIIINP